MNALTKTNSTTINSADLCSRLEQLEQGVCVVNIVSSGACGEKCLPKVKVELDGQLQDSDSIKGSKIRWFPKEPLNFVNKSKQQIARVLNAYGVRWGDMTIVPLARLDDLQSEIEAIQIEWQRNLDDMLLNYDSLIYDWIMQNQDVADIMRRYTMDKNEFGGRFKLKMLPPVAFKPLIDEGDEEAGEELANSMLDNLYEEVAKMAGDVYDRSFFIKDANGHKIPRTKANRRIKDAFKTLIGKLNGLSFLDSNIEKVIAETNRVLDSMPKEGWIENNDLAALARWTLVLSSVDSLKAHIDDNVVEYEEEVIVDDFGVLGEVISNNLDEDLNPNQPTQVAQLSDEISDTGFDNEFDEQQSEDNSVVDVEEVDAEISDTSFDNEFDEQQSEDNSVVDVEEVDAEISDTGFDNEFDDQQPEDNSVVDVEEVEEEVEVSEVEEPSACMVDDTDFIDFDQTEHYSEVEDEVVEDDDFGFGF
ncbi:DUF3150 domain-containing protein [Shewanella aestuarii]|uniref:DUF3150 domain-containing protein n=1 Tax=Shewanella aestuarii TaxID=1028752 RepID=A0A6G9QP41_9GAMM|nr:DUF3150 domain-containing protein [Shewanella aestuarii]QIR16336.1 hypothetical protein HBH39_17780 [Shewanella aestuarii]